MKEILRLPSALVNAAMACVPKDMLRHREQALSFGAEAARRRILKKTDRADFMSYILRHNTDDGIR